MASSAAGLSAINLGPHDRVWARITPETNDWGVVTLRTNVAFTEVSTGMHYLEGGEYKRSFDLIELTADGGAEAVHGQTKARFRANLNEPDGAIALSTASGHNLKVRPIGLYYHDVASDKVVRLASLQDCQAELLPPNQIVWKSVLDSIEADLRVTYTKAAIESDLILRERPKSPDAWGLDPASTRLELWSEWHGAPTPKQRRIIPKQPNHPSGRVPEIADTLLDLGGSILPSGRAFAADGSETRPAHTPARVRVPTGEEPDYVPVGKEWIELPNGSAIMIEAVRQPDIQPRLASLPEVAQNGNLGKPKDRLLCLKEAASEARTFGKAREGIQLASSEYRPRGVVVDWQWIDNGDTYHFVMGETYYIAWDVSFGTLEFDGQCFLKFAPGASLCSMGGNVICHALSPSTVFTSLDDDLNGTILPYSDHVPGWTATPALWCYAPSAELDLTGLIFRWAQTALQVSNPSAQVRVKRCRFELCDRAIESLGLVTLYEPPWDCKYCGVSNNYGGMTNDCPGDSDQDGLPDVWECQYFNNKASTQGREDDPDYDCLKNFEELQAGSNPLDYFGQPIFLTQPPVAQRLYPSPSAILTAATTPACSIFQWYRNNVAIPGATTSSLTISPVSVANDAELYRVDAKVFKNGGWLETNGITAGIYVLDSLWSSLWDYYWSHDYGGASDQMWAVRNWPVTSPTEIPPLQWNSLCKKTFHRNQPDGVKRGLTALSGNNYERDVSELGGHYFIPYTLLTPRHAYTKGHGVGHTGLRTDWENNKVWFCTESGELKEAIVEKGFVTNANGLDFSIVMFKESVPGIAPMPVMVEPPHAGQPYHVVHVLSANGMVYSNTDGENLQYHFTGNSGSPVVLSMPDTHGGDPDGVLVFIRGATTTGPTVAPAQGTDPIQQVINELSGNQNYQLTWFVP